ncbi:MAG TPA: endonuclease/exonuclease/phosphatase family protein [Nitriliruptorales bacterium]|nr:endonuclease/exonuclease/phosphatase family protein [Nitriliruptorales bacterium]
MVGAVAAVLAVPLLLATGVGYAAGRWWLAEVVGSLRPQYAIVLVVLGVLLAVTRRRATAILCLSAVALNVAPLAPLYLDRPAPAAAGAPVLDVMSLNVRIREADVQALAGYLRGAEPDLVFLFATPPDVVTALRRAGVPYRIALAATPGVDLEIAVLTRLPVRRAEILPWGPTNRWNPVEVVVEFDSRDVHLLAIHPVSPWGGGRTRMRNEQLAAVGRWAAARQGSAVVVGDLNTVPWSPAFRSALQHGRLIDSQVGSGIQPSWPSVAGPLGLPIDHALHSRQLTTVRRSVGPGFGSAHRSVRVGLALADRSGGG